MRNIRWTSVSTVGNVMLEYSLNNGASWQTIAASAPNDGVYAWTVPQASSPQCRVRVSEAAGGSPSDTSDAAFSIQASSGLGPPSTTRRSRSFRPVRRRGLRRRPPRTSTATRRKAA